MDPSMAAAPALPCLALPAWPCLACLPYAALQPTSSSSSTIAASADRKNALLKIPACCEIASQFRKFWKHARRSYRGAVAALLSATPLGSRPLGQARPAHRQTAITLTASLRCRGFNRTSFRLSRLIMPSIPPSSTGYLCFLIRLRAADWRHLQEGSATPQRRIGRRLAIGQLAIGD